MSDNAIPVGTNSVDPLRAVSDAMSTALQAARDGAADARESAAKLMPALGESISRFTYTTFYTLSYGVVFPAYLLVRAIPKDNAAVHGLVDGGLAAMDAAKSMGQSAESPAEESIAETA